MPYKDKEQQRDAQREQMRKRRAEAKLQGGSSIATEVSSPASEKPDNALLSETESLETPPLPEVELKKPIASYPIINDPYKTAELTRQLLDGKGWCFWKCSVFHNEIIVIIRDKAVEGYPENFTIYTEAELKELIKRSDYGMMRLHEAKKVTQGELIPNLT